MSTLLVASLIVNVYAALTGFFTFHNIGSLGTDLKIGVYFDPECEMPISNDFEKNWEHVERSVTNYATVYVQNENSVDVIISTSWTNWYPADFPDYANFSATLYSEPTLLAGEIKMLNMHLLIDGTYSGPDDFSFNVVVQGTEIME